MDNGFPYGDIIVIAAIAAFILLRYRAMLGERQGRDVPRPKPLQEFERVIQLPEREKASQTKQPEPDYGSLAGTYVAMRAIDKQFSPEEFIAGAKQAFEMVLEAYSSGDHDTLKMLLNDATYTHFADSLNAQQAAGRTQQTTLVALKLAEVTEATLQGSQARIAVHFVSEQVLLWRDAQGNLVEGDPSHQQRIEDHWVFERNLNHADPAWKIVET